MKILVTGANGFLGQHLCFYLLHKGFNVIATGRGDCRIEEKTKLVYENITLTNEEEVEKLFSRHQPDAVIHTAAMSKPDECHVQRETCILNNVTATKYLLEKANPDTHFIYLSTDFIFGEGGPHAEDAVPAPLNFYGESKLQAEQLVQASGLLAAIVRPVFIYGPSWKGMRPSFLHWVKNNLEQQKPIKVVSDQLRTPTYVYDICKGITAIIRQKEKGIFHLAGKDIISPYEMALTVAKVAGLDASLIENVTSDTFPEPVQRAKKSGLLIEKARNILHYEPVSFEEGVKLTFET